MQRRECDSSSTPFDPFSFLPRDPSIASHDTRWTTNLCKHNIINIFHKDLNIFLFVEGKLFIKLKLTSTSSFVLSPFFIFIVSCIISFRYFKSIRNGVIQAYSWDWFTVLRGGFPFCPLQPSTSTSSISPHKPAAIPHKGNGNVHRTPWFYK